MTLKEHLKSEIAVLESMLFMTPLLSKQLNCMRELLALYEAPTKKVAESVVR